ncbi:MAG TPA: hypothetical protein VH681_13015 [Nitrospiraceae bacterium]|jgi:hypothetical protein
MRDFMKGIGVLLSLILYVGCATAVPPDRLNSYLPQDTEPRPEALAKVEPRPLQAGLVLISDTSEPGAAPNLPDEAFVRLGEQLKQEFSRVLPVTITEILSAEHIQPKSQGDWAEFAALGKSHKLDYLVVVVLSSTEQEYPMTLFLGWTTHAQPGYRRDNYSLLEFALLDLKNNQTLMRSEARGWATLDRPSAPGINQWYPVIYLRPQDPERRIWPPTYEGAPNTLRVVSFNDAAKRLTFRLQNSWLGQLEAESAARRASS